MGQLMERARIPGRNLQIKPYDNKSLQENDSIGTIRTLANKFIYSNIDEYNYST